ncbi:MAG TPA: SDR family NAD(P)-dependent oxidoreductase [Planctomycetia bacterium]|nr:SDR family NAD(P)-dependent oxidoreductase [Planctomycetia bacterium]
MFGRKRTIAGKRVLVTGASSGIGRATAKEFAARGAKVLAVARTESKLAALAEEVRAAGGTLFPFVADICKEEDRQAAVAEAALRLGGLDILVNNAGIGAFGHFIDLGPEVLRQLFEVNFFALAECCRAAIPELAKGDDPTIVNVSSMTGRRGIPAWTDYSASKFAVCGFSEALRPELARFGIELTLVVPGLTRSDLGRHLLVDRGRMPPPFEKGIPTETVAAAIVNGVERRKNEVRVERNARLLLFFNWLAPRFVDWRLRRIVARLYSPSKT